MYVFAKIEIVWWRACMIKQLDEEFTLMLLSALLTVFNFSRPLKFLGRGNIPSGPKTAPFSHCSNFVCSQPISIILGT